MKISFFIGSMGTGGAERVISILANEYSRKGWQTEIVMLLGDTVAYDLESSIGLIKMNGKRDSYIKNALDWLKDIRSYIKRSNPDVIVSFIGRINALVLTATIGLNVPVIVSERNDPKRDGRGKMMLQYCNLIYHFARAIVFQTKYEQSCFSKTLYKKGVIIANPIDLKILPAEKKRLEIITVGRLSPQKNQKMLIDAFFEVHKKFPDVSLKIYGDGTEKNALAERIAQYRLADSVEICGNVKDIHERMSGALVFVLTSEFEGLSNALLEAMSLGIFCISTDYPGAEEIIDDKKNGLLVPRGNVPALVKAIVEVLENPILYQKCIKNGLEKSKIYKKATVLNNWIDVIERN